MWLGQQGPALFVVLICGWLARPCHSDPSSGSLDVDASRWAKQLLSAQSKQPTIAAVQANNPAFAAPDALARAAGLAARRSAAAAAGAAEAAAAAVSLSQHAAAWLRPGQHGTAWAQASARGNSSFEASLATAAAESKDASATYAAVAAARKAANDMQHAEALAARVVRERQELAKLQESLEQRPPQNGSAAAVKDAKLHRTILLDSVTSGSASEDNTPESEERMIKGERVAAETAGLCVLTICLVLAWFQSIASDVSYKHWGKSRHEAEQSFFNQPGLWWMCCCCRRVACCGNCVFAIITWFASCGWTTIGIVLMVFGLLGFGLKQLWDQHLLQPHLEEATMYLFIFTVAFVILLILLGEFVRWLREKVGFVHDKVSFVHDKMDDVMDFLGFQDDELDEEEGLWDDAHAGYGPMGSGRSMPKANPDPAATRAPKDRPGERMSRHRKPGGSWWMLGAMSKIGGGRHAPRGRP